MRYLLRPDSEPKLWTLYLSPHGCVIRRKLTRERAMEYAEEYNRMALTGWTRARESERIRRRWIECEE